MRNALLILLVLFTTTGSVRAQLVEFRNPILAPLQFNPGFAGLTDEKRATLAYRNQWPATTLKTHMLYASYDQISNRLKGGIGVDVIHEVYDVLSSTRISGIYSPKFSLGSNWTLSPGLKLGVQQMSYDAIFLADSIGTLVNYPLRHLGMHLSPAILINSSSFYFGVSTDYLATITLQEKTAPDDIFLSPRRRWKIQSGYRFQPKNTDKWSLSATALVVLASNRDMLTGYLTYQRKWAILGLGISSFSQGIRENALSVTAGVKHRKFKLLGAYDRSIGVLSTPSFELSLMYYFSAKKGEINPG